MPEFILYALLAGIGVSVVAGPLGSFVVWRRMAYFGDTLAHSSLLGIALALWLSIAPGIAVFVVSLGLAMLLVALQNQRQLASDTLLGILAHSALATGMIALSLIPGARMNLEGLLFGNLLAITGMEVLTIWTASILVCLLLTLFWNQLLSITIHEELAQAEGVAVTGVKTLLMLTLALVIALAIKVVGVLLITALMVIPAATARRLAKTPEQMAIIASLAAALSVCVGLWLAWQWDTPVGPSVVMAATALFLLSLTRLQQS